MALGGLGLASSLFVVVRVAGTWRVAPSARIHHLEIAGQRLAYPAANLDAIAILALAALGLLVLGIALWSAMREASAAARFSGRIQGRAIGRTGGAVVIDDDRPQAFCAGLWRPQAYVSRGAVELLDAAALRAVIAHERHHARRRDPLRLAAGRVTARALFFLPGLAALVDGQQALAELGADESVVIAAPASRPALARAILGFSDAAGPGAGVDPARVDHLIGESPRWRFPVALCACAAAICLLLVAVSALLGRVASGTASLAPPLLSAQPCVVVLALVPGMALLVGATWRRRRGARA